MQDSKEIDWGNDYVAEPEDEAAQNDASVETPEANEKDGWQQYRRWISKAPAPNRRRSGVDPSLYTWKGYRDWTEQVKRNWSENN